MAPQQHKSLDPARVIVASQVGVPVDRAQLLVSPLMRGALEMVVVSKPLQVPPACVTAKSISSLVVGSRRPAALQGAFPHVVAQFSRGCDKIQPTCGVVFYLEGEKKEMRCGAFE